MSEEDNQQQAEEVEVLQSIYPAEYAPLEQNSWRAALSTADANGTVEAATLSLYEGTSHSNCLCLTLSPQADPVHVIAKLYCGMPVDYPSTSVLQVVVENEKGLSGDQIKEIQRLAQENADTSLGMPSVFIVASAVQEYLQENNVPGQDNSMYADMMRRMQRKDVEDKRVQEKAAIKIAADSERKATAQIDPEELERIRKRQAGVQVTTESFMAWKAKFDAEMASKSIKSDNNDTKISGKQWFLQHAGSSNTEEDDIILQGESETVDEDQLAQQLEDLEEDDSDDSDYVDEGEEDDEN